MTTTLPQGPRASRSIRSPLAGDQDELLAATSRKPIYPLRAVIQRKRSPPISGCCCASTSSPAWAS